MEAKNIDDILVEAINNPNPTESRDPSVNNPTEGKTVDPVEEVNSSSKANESYLEPPVIQEKEASDSMENKSEATPQAPIDEYGNPVEKQKVYTEEEVQRLIHDRLSRGRRTENPPQQVQQIQQDFKADENSEEPWDVQLKKFVDQTIDEREQKAAQKKWQQQESAKQADFESKFTTGMNKYTDFHQVVANKPITDHMLLATRSLDNPAAFIYGACKLHPTEIDKIARMEDPYAQASEVGRLHERMIKERRLASSAPRPLETPKGDMPQKTSANQISIDERIHNYARQKRK